MRSKGAMQTDLPTGNLHVYTLASTLRTHLGYGCTIILSFVRCVDCKLVIRLNVELLIIGVYRENLVFDYVNGSGFKYNKLYFI